MRILITNDDGVEAEGLRILAEAVSAFGEICIVAPKKECSAMSHNITLFDEMLLRPVDYPVAKAEAYALEGTPADCVRVGMRYVLAGRRPDLILSGLNEGYNCGLDIVYSGTVAAAMEGMLFGLPSFAFSAESKAAYALAAEKLPELLRLLMAKETHTLGVWNVNFPPCSPEECKGILWDRIPAKLQYYDDHYEEQGRVGEQIRIRCRGELSAKELPEGSDLKALEDGYISVGWVRSIV